uniref:Uncharacterized protein n=1 Tax=Romanomermis culicivorax TaxID=13658 RepID=A0A915IPZ0_ROMCU
MKRCKRLSKQKANLPIPKSITVKLTTEHLLLGQLIKCIITNAIGTGAKKPENLKTSLSISMKKPFKNINI